MYEAMTCTEQHFLTVFIDRLVCVYQASWSTNVIVMDNKDPLAEQHNLIYFVCDIPDVNVSPSSQYEAEIRHISEQGKGSVINLIFRVLKGCGINSTPIKIRFIIIFIVFTKHIHPTYFLRPDHWACCNCRFLNTVSMKHTNVSTVSQL